LEVELIIRGKDKIEDSLGELIQGELMDGDNKIQCDVCTQKKATTRRTCFGHLPNTMILHLKRFDLDFQTFETVKLNNRMAFPLRINMFEYTKEGIEQLERKKLAEGGGGGVEGEDDDEMSMVPADAWTTKQTI
jgi:ubiquitin carboxyl-terminal hydrolase 9/24